MGKSVQVLVGGEFTPSERPFGYDPVFDEFRVAGSAGASPPPMTHCPWCEVALGASRRAAWFDRLDQLGLTPDDHLPPDLRTDAWWAADASSAAAPEGAR